MSDKLNDFVERISNEILASENRRIVLMGNDVLDPRGGYAKTYGIYPTMVREISKQIIDRVKRSNTSIFSVILINDWKFLKSLEGGSKIRESYWQNPDFDYSMIYEDVWCESLLPGLGLGKKHIEPKGRISEQRLHNQFAHLAKNKRDFIEKAMSELPLNCTMDGACTATKCASEVIMVLRHFYRLKIDRVIALLPSECYFPIEAGIAMTQVLSDILMPNLMCMEVDHHSFNSLQPCSIDELFEPNLPENRRRISHVICPSV